MEKEKSFNPTTVDCEIRQEIKNYAESDEAQHMEYIVTQTPLLNDGGETLWEGVQTVISHGEFNRLVRIYAEAVWPKAVAAMAEFDSDELSVRYVKTSDGPHIGAIKFEFLPTSEDVFTLIVGSKYHWRDLEILASKDLRKPVFARYSRSPHSPSDVQLIRFEFCERWDYALLFYCVDPDAPYGAPPIPQLLSVDHSQLMCLLHYCARVRYGIACNSIAPGDPGEAARRQRYAMPISLEYRRPSPLVDEGCRIDEDVNPPGE